MRDWILTFQGEKHSPLDARLDFWSPCLQFFGSRLMRSDGGPVGSIFLLVSHYLVSG